MYTSLNPTHCEWQFPIRQYFSFTTKFCTSYVHSMTLSIDITTVAVCHLSNKVDCELLPNITKVPGSYLML